MSHLSLDVTQTTNKQTKDFESWFEFEFYFFLFITINSLILSKIQQVLLYKININDPQNVPTLLTFDQIFIAYNKTGSKIQRKHQTLHWIQMRWYQNWATTLEWSPFGNITASLPFSIRNETVRFAQNNLIHLTKIDGKIESISTLPNKVTNYELNMEMNIGLSSRQQLNWIINTRCACTTDAHWKRLAFLFLFSLRVKCWT